MAINKLKQKNKLFSNNTREILFCLSVIGLPVLQFIIFYLGVNINSFLLAFKNYEVTTTGEMLVSWVGFLNFKTSLIALFSSTGMLVSAFKNTLVIFFINLFVGIPLTLGFSFYIYKSMPCGKIFNVILFLPSVISTIVLVILFSYFVDRVIPEVIEKIFHVFMEGPLTKSTITKFCSIVFFYIWINFGLGILMYSSAMNQISDGVVEAAQIDGVTPIKEFWYISLPMIYPTITSFLVISLAGMFTNQANLFSFFQEDADPKIQTLGYYLFTRVVGTDSYIDFPKAAALGIILTILAVPITNICKYFLEKVDPNN